MKLTNRQKHIARRYAEGKNVKMIAGELNLSHKTVEYHYAQVRRKLGIKTMVEMVHYGIAKLGVPLMFALVLVVGCQPKSEPKPAVVAFAAIRAKVRTVSVAAVIVPPKMYGPAWDYGDMPPGLFFEVWSSTNLTEWVLRTNTVAKAVVFPSKQMEFYKVRANLNGIVSDWATTASK